MATSPSREFSGDGPYFFSEAGGPTLGQRTLPASPEESTMIESKLNILRANILSGVEHDESGIDIGSVSDYLSIFGIPVPSFIGVRPENVESLIRFVGQRQGREFETLGGSFSELGLTFVVRNGVHEAANGPGITESRLVHEASHAHTKYPTTSFMYEQNGRPIITLLRNGFDVEAKDYKRYGMYYEEAFAGLMENRFVTQHLGLPNGFTAEPDPELMSIGGIHSTSNFYQMPSKYFFYEHPEAIRGVATTPSYAAYGMELLIAKDPAIFDAMLLARTSVDGLREFAARINALHPGLYRYLDQCPYDYDSFVDGTTDILDTLYDGDSNKALAAVL